MSELLVRDAVIEDMAAVRDIYNALVPSTTVAWTEVPETLRQRQEWFRHLARDGYPVLVAVDGSGEVIGFAAYGSFRGAGRWPGYRHTVEHTIHVREDRWGLGAGRRLLEELIVRARAAGMHVVVGAIDGANDASLRFHERLGFVEVARMPEVGRKFDQWLDLVLVQLVLDDAGGW